MTTLTTTVKQPLGLMGHAAAAPRVPVAAGITGSDVFRIIRQRLLLILLVWIMGSALTVGVTILTQRYFPEWTAASLIRVISPTPEDPFNPWGVRLDRDTIDRNIQDQAAMIRDPEMLREVLTSPEIRNDTEWFRQFADNIDRALDDLDKNLSSNPVRGSSLLQVSMPTRNPKDSPKIVNKVVDVYIKRVHGWSSRMFSGDIDAFKGELARKDNELSVVNSQIRELEAEGGIPAMLRGAPTITTRLDRLQQELVQKESEMELLRARYRAYSESGAEGMQSNPELMANVEENPKIQNSVRFIRDLKQEKEALLLRFGPQHQEIRERDNRIASAEEELAQTRQILLNEQRGSLMEQYRMAYYSTLQAVAELKESAAEATNAQLDLDRKLRRYDELLRQRESLERERERIAQHNQNLEMVARTSEPARISIFRKATVPLEPSRPKPKLWIPVGTGISLFLAVGLALALSLLDTSIRTPADIVRHAGMSLLGSVPVLDDEEAAVEEIETAARVAPHSLVAECFRQIRANLLFSSPMEQQRGLLITSASASEGKTCVTINLGVTLAQGGRRILLVDANFRRPGLHRAFSISNQTGLSNLLVGQGRLCDFVSHTDLPNLDVLATGPCPPNPAELLASNYLREVLTQAVETYDQVLFDGPPVLLVSDSLVLATLVDGVVLVCRARTGRGMVQRAKSQLGLVNARIIGAILNAVETTRGGYFRKYYREFYDYQERSPEDVAAEQSVEALPPVRSKDADKASSVADQEFKPPEIDERGGDVSPFELPVDLEEKPKSDKPKDDDDFKWPGT